MNTKYKKRLKLSEFRFSKELAELVGIIIGDGHISKRGYINIAFDPKKDTNFIEKRVINLIKKFTKNKIYYHGNNTIEFNDRSFIRFLEFKCELKPGNKTKNKIVIPNWCFKNKEYLIAILRGLFDTDGCIIYHGRICISFGRFSTKELTQSVKKALDILNIKTNIYSYKNQHKVETNRNEEVIKFFMNIGSSNIKHIVRFLLWRIDKKESRIEREGLNKLINKLNVNIQRIEIPFLWDKDNIQFKEYFKEDKIKLENLTNRNYYNWNKITKEILRKNSSIEIAKVLNIQPRSVRKWRENIRNPSPQFIPKLIKIAQNNNIDISKFKL